MKNNHIINSIITIILLSMLSFGVSAYTELNGVNFNAVTDYSVTSNYYVPVTVNASVVIKSVIMNNANSHDEPPSCAIFTYKPSSVINGNGVEVGVAGQMPLTPYYGKFINTTCTLDTSYYAKLNDRKNVTFYVGFGYRASDRNDSVINGYTNVFPGYVPPFFSGTSGIFTYSHDGYFDNTSVENTIWPHTFTLLKGFVYVDEPKQFTATVENTSYELITKKTTQKIVIGNFNATKDLIRYAVDCDYGTVTVIWSDVFSPAYNVTNKNISFSNNSVFTNNGLTTSNDAFILEKVGEYSQGESVDFDAKYIMADSGNVTFEITDVSDTFTYVLRVERIGDNVSFYTTQYGYSEFYMGSATAVSDWNDVLVRFSPITLNDGTIDYHKIISYNGVVVSSWRDANFSEAEYLGKGIKYARIFTDSAGIVSVKSISLVKSPDDEPEYVTFQNGYTISSGGVTTKSPSVYDVMIGSGFTVRPDYNNVFYSTCPYVRAGCYTQRHYMTDEENYNDYSNYKDIQVCIDEGLNLHVVDSNGKPINDDSTVSGQVGNLIGVDSDTAMFVIWIVATMIIAILLAVFASPVIGAIFVPASLITGSIVKIVPVWVTVVLVIICGAIIAVAFKNIFGDAGGDK